MFYLQQNNLHLITGSAFFHAFTESDSTSYFFEKSKAVWLKAWLKSSKRNVLDAVFTKLSWCPTKACVDECFHILKGLVCEVYLSTANELRLSQIRFQLFETSTSNNFRSLPPTENALYQHVLRSCFQAGWFWGNTAHQNNTPCKTERDWFVDEVPHLHITWTTSSPTDLLTKIIYSCKCRSKTAKYKKCKCGQLQVRCTKFCSRKQRCTRD